MWFYAALGMAALSGAYTIISKQTLKSINPITFYWVVLAVSTPIIAILSFKSGIPEINTVFLFAVAGSVISYTISKIIFYKTIQKSELSHVYPLISLGPIFTLILSMLIFSEIPNRNEIIGGLITLLGTYVLNISSMHEGLLEPIKIILRNKLARWMLVSVAIGSVVSITDKISIHNTNPENLMFAMLFQYLVIVLSLLPWIIKNHETALNEILINKKTIFVLALIGTASNILAFIALSAENPGIVTSIFRTQVFFVLLFSFMFLKDKPKTETIIGAIIMIIGLVVLKLAS